MGGNRIFLLRAQSHYWETLGRILFVVLGAPENFFIEIPFIIVMLTLIRRNYMVIYHSLIQENNKKRSPEPKAALVFSIIPHV